MKKMIKSIITIFIIIIIISNNLFANENKPNIKVEFSPGNKTKYLISKEIKKAKSTIDIASYCFTNKFIVKELINAKKKGINIRILVDYNRNNTNYSIINLLLKNKIKFKLNKKYLIMHNKFIIIDKISVGTGSLNYTNNAIYKNAENIIFIENQPKIAKKYFKEFNKLWKEGINVKIINNNLIYFLS